MKIFTEPIEVKNIESLKKMLYRETRGYFNETLRFELEEAFDFLTRLGYKFYKIEIVAMLQDTISEFNEVNKVGEPYKGFANEVVVLKNGEKIPTTAEECKGHYLNSVFDKEIKKRILSINKSR